MHFYFMQKAFFVLEIFPYFVLTSCYIEKRPDKKDMVNFKISGLQITTIHILFNSSKSKGSQTIRFG